MDLIQSIIENYPRVSGIVLGIALHPLLTAIVLGR